MDIDQELGIEISDQSLILQPDYQVGITIQYIHRLIDL